MFRIPPIKCEPQNILLNKYIKQEHEHIDETVEYNLDYDGYYKQSTYQCYKKDSKNTEENVGIHVKTEVDVIDDTIYESFFMRDNNNNYEPSVAFTTYHSINSHVENNLNIKSSTATFIPTKHKVKKSKKDGRIKNKAHVIDDVIFESFVNHDNKTFVPSVESTTYYDINSHVENKPTNYNLNIKTSTTTFKPTKNKVITSKKKSQNLYECFTCNKSFSSKGNMKTHFMVHTGEKPHQCFICNKSFSSKGNMKTHIRIHTGEKPHQCFICNKSFAQISHLNTHKIIHKFHQQFNIVLSVKNQLHGKRIRLIYT